jgi:hypothetical protein
MLQFQMFQSYVAVSISEVCCKAFVQNVSSVSRCMLQSFFIWILHMFSHICCNSILQMFQLFQSYVAVSVFLYCNCFYLDVAFTHMLQAYVPNVSSVSNVCCIRVFHVASVDRQRWCP